MNMASLTFELISVAHVHPDVAKVLVGIQVTQNTAQDFEAFLSKVAFHYTEETDNSVFKRFLQ